MPILPPPSSRRRSLSSNDDYCAHFFITCLATVAAVAAAAAVIVGIATLISVAPPLGILLMAMCCWLYLAYTCNQNTENTATPPRQGATFFIVNPVGIGYMPSKPYTYATQKTAEAVPSTNVDDPTAAVATIGELPTPSSTHRLMAARSGLNPQPTTATDGKAPLSPINGFMARH